MENPRSQNYEHELRAELKGNPLAWFVNGMVKEQIAGGGGYNGVLGCGFCAGEESIRSGEGWILNELGEVYCVEYSRNT